MSSSAPHTIFLDKFLEYFFVVVLQMLVCKIIIELASVDPISIATRGGCLVCLELTSYKKSDVFMSSD
jgi:hypothetical protein